MTPEDLFRIEWVGDPEISPDGRQLCFVRTKVDEDNNGYSSAIWLLDLTRPGAEPRRLTFGAPTDASAVEENPRWSPDGQRIAFKSNRSGKPQIYLLPLEGGEARSVTTQKQGAGDFSWSPDGRRIAAALLDPEPENDEADGKTKPSVRVIDRLRYKFNGRGFLDPNRRTHIYVIDARTGEATQITEGEYSETAPAWSPDGSLIAFSSSHRSEEVENWTDIFVVPAAGGEVRRVTPSRGMSGEFAFSPDGGQIAYFGHDEGNRVENDDLWVIPTEGGEPRNLTKAFDHTQGNHIGGDARWDHGQSGPVWSADGREIYLTFTERGNCPLFAVDARSGAVRKVSGEEELVVTSFSLPGGGRGAAAAAGPIALVGAKRLSPGDLYLVEVSGNSQPVQISSLNRGLFAEIELSIPEPMPYPSEDGTELQAWIMRPIGLAEGETAPLVLEIHGGPHSAYGNAFFHEFQLLAARGYAVLYTNPHGSTGYGLQFTRGCVGDWGGLDYRDIMRGVDEALSRFGWIDRERLGVTGGSYGGYMTNWIVGQTGRFRAAVTQRSISNLYSMYGTSDIGFHFNFRELGDADMWDNEERLMERSPIRYVRQVETPLLLIHAEEDYRCPMEQAEQMYVALRRLGKDTQLVRFSGENHELSRSGKPFNRIERLSQIIGWFDRYLGEGRVARNEVTAARE